MKIFNLSSLSNIQTLPKTVGKIQRKHVIKFNPSICKILPNVYVIIYRVYISNKKFRNNNLIAKNHAQSYTPWGSLWDYKYNGAGISIVKFNPLIENFQIIQETIINTMDDILEPKLIQHSDLSCILLYHTNNSTNNQNISLHVSNILFSDQAYTSSQNDQFKFLILKPKTICTNSIYSNVVILSPISSIEINPKKKNEEKVYENKELKTKVKRETYLQTSIDNPWEFRLIKGNTCPKIIPQKSDFFLKLRKWYQDAICFYPSTPLVNYNKNELIGVGYSRVDFWKVAELIKNKPLRTKQYYKKSKNSHNHFNQGFDGKDNIYNHTHMDEYKNSGISKFMDQIQQSMDLPEISKINQWSEFKEGSIHHQHFCFLFIYTVCKKTLQLSKFSYCFMPHKTPERLISTYTIPSGISVNTKNVIISCGFHHTSCNLILYERDEIDQKLIYDYNENFPKLNDFVFSLVE